jgi:hypothetical protein
MHPRFILLVASSISSVLAVPLPLHDTNTQRLPDRPAGSISYSDHPTTVVVQKHKAVPEIAAYILPLCDRGLSPTKAKL